MQTLSLTHLVVVIQELRFAHLVQGSGGRAIGTSVGTGHNASASQGLTSVATTSDNTTASNAIHNNAANGSSAAQLSSYTQTGSTLQANSNRNNSNHSSHSESAINAAADDQVQNAVADSTGVTSKTTQDQVRASVLNCFSQLPCFDHPHMLGGKKHMLHAGNSRAGQPYCSQCSQQACVP